MAFECMDKQRDGSGVIRKILLRDINTGDTRWVDKDKLKALMSQKRINVTNLKIDNSGKLVDTESAQTVKSIETQNRERSARLDNDKLLEYIKNLESNSKEGDARILRVLKELYIRQNELSDKIDTLLLSDNNQTSGTEERINELTSYLVKNLDKLDDMTAKIDNINKKILSATPKTTGETKDEDGKAGAINGTAGYKLPDGHKRMSYDEVFLSQNNGVLAATNNADLNRELNKMYEQYFDGNEIDIELINKLRPEINKSYEAYYNTKQLYEGQLNEYVGCFNDCSLTSLVYGSLADKVNEIPGLAGELVTKKSGVLSGVSMKKLSGAIKDVVYTIGTQIPGINYTARQKRIENNFAASKKLTPAQIQAIQADVEGLWNSAVRFLVNDSEWEIKLFAIQYLNMLYMGEYDATDRKFTAFESDKGKMKTFTDTTFSNKYCNSLSEIPLQNLCEYMASPKIESSTSEAYQEACERVVIAYFAAKKVMYGYGIYPFDKSSDKKKNWVFIDLVKVASVMLNVKPGIIEGIIWEVEAPDNIQKRETKMGRHDRYKREQAKFSEVLGGS